MAAIVSSIRKKKMLFNLSLTWILKLLFLNCSFYTGDVEVIINNAFLFMYVHATQ